MYGLSSRLFLSSSPPPPFLTFCSSPTPSQDIPLAIAFSKRKRKRLLRRLCLNGHHQPQNCVCFAKKSVNAKPFPVRTTFCTHQNFCKRNEALKIPSTSFGGCKTFVRRENPLFLDIRPSLGHQILQYMDYEANVTAWLPASVLSLNILRASVNRRMTLPIRIFLRNKISGKWRWTGADGFRTKILQGEQISSAGENDGDGGVFLAELKPPKFITGES